MKNKAFTLAEVLITLGIIGAVAAFTLPTLISKYQELKKENVFNILKTLGIKCISVLCCYGGLQHSYQEEGMVIKPYFNNTGVLQGEKISDNVFKFTPCNA